MENSFYQVLGRVEAALKGQLLDPKSIDELLPLMSEPAIRNHAFGIVVEPAWLKALYDAGAFKPRPSGVLRDRNMLWFSEPSPETELLARMASRVPELVLQIGRELQSDENLTVHMNLADAALAMPVKLTAEWCRTESEWIRGRTALGWGLPEKYGDLVVALAERGLPDDALDLAKALLMPVPDPRAIADRTVTPGFQFPPDPKPKFDDWVYEQVIKKIEPVLRSHTGLDALRLFASLLVEGVRMLRERTDEQDTPNDGSWVWRPAIEDHEQNSARRMMDFLVEATRDTAESLMPICGTSVYEVLEHGHSLVFRRIELHLRRLWPDVDWQGTIAIAVQADCFDNVGLHHEYFHLVKEHYGRFPRSTQEKYLDLVDRGPLRDQYPRLAEAQWEPFSRSWEYRKLLPVRAFLTGDWLKRFERRRAEFGESSVPPDLDVFTSSWTGPTSPKKTEDLRVMSVAEVLEYLRVWEPTGSEEDPSREGLGRQLTTDVTARASEYGPVADHFAELDPTYVRAIIRGLESAIPQSDKIFAWGPVLALCGLVVKHPFLGAAPAEGYEGRNLGWGWTRTAIASLITRAFEDHPNSLPLSFRSTAWEIVARLIADPDPDDDYRKGYPSSQVDPYTNSINSTRGQAMHAVIRYALWLRTKTDGSEAGGKGPKIGLKEMPEVREVLDRHLDPTIDPSPTVRSVYGRWFPWFFGLDESWALGIVPRIFPTASDQEPLRLAAWSSYITFCDVFTGVFGALESEYAAAIERLGITLPWAHSFKDIDKELAEHLMIAYVRDLLKLDDTHGMLVRFFERGSLEIRSHALEYAGRTLHEEPRGIGEEYLERWKALWAWRVQVVSKKSQTSERAELAAFGWWFASKKFDIDWSLSQLKEALKLSQRPMPPHYVTSTLAEVAIDRPLGSIQVLQAMLGIQVPEWEIRIAVDQFRQVITAAKQSSDPNAQACAIDVINRLGERGYIQEFRDLL